MPRAEFKVMLTPVRGNPIPKWEDMAVQCRADMSDVGTANAYARYLLRTLPDAMNIRWNWQGSLMGHYNHRSGIVEDDTALVTIYHTIVNPDNDKTLAEPGVYTMDDRELTGLFAALSSRRSLKNQRKRERDWWLERFEANPDDWVAEESYHKMAYEHCLHRRILDEYEDELSWGWRS